LHIWTETPRQEIWNQFRYLESPTNLYDLLTGTIQSERSEHWEKGEVTKERAYDIAACIRQADEYYQAAETVSLATQPLLQYYGALALAKACILANDQQAQLSNLSYHGLQTRSSKDNLQSYIDAPESWQIEQEFAVTNDGVFPRLCNLSDESIPKGTELRIKDLLRILPDLTDLYVRHYGEPSHCLYLYDMALVEQKESDVEQEEIDIGKRFEIFFASQKFDQDYLYKIFPEFHDGFETAFKHTVFPGFHSISLMSEFPSFIKIEKGTISGKFLVRPYAQELYHSATVQYATLFILSNIVRYKPAFWMRVIQGEKTGSGSIVAAFCNISRRRFPNDILEIIWQEEFSYGTPAYLG
jgi:YaaC-like Protein